MQHALKPVEPAIEFRSNPNLFSKQLCKTSAAQSGFSRYLQDTADVRYPHKLVQRVSHARMQLERSAEPPEKHRFQHPKFLRHSARFPKPVTQIAGRRAPNLIERYSFVIEEVRRFIEKRASAAGPKNDTDNRSKYCRIYGPESRSHSDNEDWRWQPCFSGRKILLPGKGVCEVNNKLESSAGQHTFFAVRRQVFFAVPELLDIRCERCDGPMADDHARDHNIGSQSESRTIVIRITMLDTIRATACRAEPFQ